MLQLESYLKKQLERVFKSLNYPSIPYQFDRPKLKSYGDISVNLAMLMAKTLKKNPRKIAEHIVQVLDLDAQRIQKVEIAGAGFINFFIAKSELQKRMNQILKQGADYGKFQADSPQKALVEFVSANPTGPLSIGHGRQAVLGDTVANLLEWSGYEVTREYYFNNAGRQMRVLADSVRMRYEELQGGSVIFPEDYYQGEYIRTIAQKVLTQKGKNLTDKTADLDAFKSIAEAEIFTDIKETLANLNIYFDSFFNESALYETGDIDAVIEQLKEKGLAYEKDGALWFKTTQMGLEQDRVIVKSSGEPTYRLPDIAYHQKKYERGYQIMINLLGADHIATYPDVLAGIQALGYPPEKVKVLIHQFVTLSEGGQKMKMSTRKANFITLDELVTEVGKDVTRWFFVMRSMQSHLNFDLQLAKTQSDENPVYYNQYAHARICSILRNAAAQQIHARETTDDLHCLAAPAEMQLIKKLMEFPKTIQRCANEYEPHLLPLYLSDVSAYFHKFYTDCRVISDDPELTRNRLNLCMATKTVLANGFQILGISAPETM